MMPERSQAVDQRQFGRRQSQFHGWIKAHGRRRVACIVRNFSAAGALVEPLEPFNAKGPFTLTIEAIGLDIACSVKHKADGMLGVSFSAGAQTEHRASTYEQLLELAEADRMAAERV
jgi:hypothetical protein